MCPMDCAAFCQACRLKPGAPGSYEQFSLVGGIPKYWEFVEPGADAVALAESLFFDFVPCRLESQWQLSALSRKHTKVCFAVFDATEIQDF